MNAQTQAELADLRGQLETLLGRQVIRAEHMAVTRALTTLDRALAFASEAGPLAVEDQTVGAH